MPPRAPNPDTKERLLDAAERQFVAVGVEAASLRTITQEAQANLAAVNYHFGSKDGLIEAVFARRIAPVNRERIARLDALEASGDGDLESVLRAFFRPALALAADPHAGPVCARLVGRLHTENNDRIRSIVREQFREVASRFLNAFGRECPHLNRSDLFWRTHFLIGAMAHTMADLFDLRAFSDGLCDPRDIGTTTEELVRFAASGMRAPACAQPEARR